MTPVVMPEAPPPELVSQSEDLDVMPDSDEDANDACVAEVPEELDKIICDDGVGIAENFGNCLKFSAERDSLELFAIECGTDADLELAADLGRAADLELAMDFVPVAGLQDDLEPLVTDHQRAMGLCDGVALAADSGLTTDLSDGVEHGGHLELGDCVAAAGGNGGSTPDELGPPIC